MEIDKESGKHNRETVRIPETYPHYLESSYLELTLWQIDVQIESNPFIKEFKIP